MQRRVAAPEIVSRSAGGRFLYPSDVLAILLVLDAVVIGFFLLSVADAIPASGLVLDFLNPNGEANVFVAYSAIKLAFCAFVLAACAIAQRRYVLLIVAMIPLLMAVDEIGQVHENVGNYLSERFLSGGITLETSSPHDWPYTYGIPMGVILMASLYFLGRKSAVHIPLLLRFGIGVTVLLSGAVVMACSRETAPS